MSTSDNIVSVIVPVYKVENELKRCVDSILNQTYKNLEVILIDDESPDQCPAICDEYAEKDKRVRVIHKKNGGLSEARNFGLDIASGAYIAFVDSDDWVETDYIETLYTNAIKEDADISIVGYTMVWETGNIRRFSEDKEYYVFDREQAIRELLVQNKYSCMVCQKLYKSYIFEDVRFPVGKVYEDVAVSLPTFTKINKAVVTGKSKYNYFQRSASIVNSKFNANKLYFLDCCKNIIKYSDENSKKYDKEAHVFYLRALMMLVLQLYKENRCENDRIEQQLEEEIRRQKEYIWNNSYLQLRKKIVLTMICFRFPKKILADIWKKRVEG